MTNSPDFLIDLSNSKYAHLRPAPIGAVTLTDTFWEPRRVLNRERTLPFQFEKLKDSGVLDNFRRAAGQSDLKFRGPVFADSDLYKWLEAAATTLGTHPTPELEAMVNESIELIEGAQCENGYLDTAFMFERTEKRWVNLRDDHEMYCAGHFIQAAVAHFRATDSPRLLNVARRVADHIDGIFGPDKRQGTGGHPEIEMALVELFRATDERKYLQLAEYLVEARGYNPTVCVRSPDDEPGAGDAYRQDHLPYCFLEEVTGHAVRMLYLAAGATDIALETGDIHLVQAISSQWQNFTTKRMYVSGGAGSRYEGEAFGNDWELPNARAYTETCAAIASVMWHFRLLSLPITFLESETDDKNLLYVDAEFADLLEHTLYNAVLPGISLGGGNYFYQNPLSDDGTHRRSAWFGCACCPPNVARLLAQLPGYFYGTRDNEIWVHLYAANAARLELASGQIVELEMRTNYPWDGEIEIEVQSAGDFALHLRVPAWCDEMTLKINGETALQVLAAGNYCEIRRDWKVGDRVQLSLPMPVRRMISHPYVLENADHVALMRGPILYAVEAVDQPGFEDGFTDLHELVLPRDAEITAQFEADLLKGVVTLTAMAQAGYFGDVWTRKLYNRAPADSTRKVQAMPLKAIPYYAWANRAAGQMRVWLREK